MKKNKVKVGIIGLGAIGSVHADAYRAAPDAEIAAICDIAEARLTALGGKYDVQQRFKDYRDLLKSDLDAVRSAWVINCTAPWRWPR
ncbi:MAG: Gfo/Idh/MocA family oxidoreductase [Lentisphaerae bacterium]|nr:Gfo/Idh/MocA family oxidoreductase [Lentisphaerota bacterium]